MAFWGVEVKPGKPITHFCEKARGRLRISQATLAIGDATKKSIVQCNVSKRSPVLLCVLLPNQTESCHLDLEFEEADDVVFSVIGPRSVYLTGYYLSQHQQSIPHSDTESYGVDIENTQSDGSSSCSDDDKYEDSFIDDGELQIDSPSPVSRSKVMVETMPEKDKLKDKKAYGKRLKKKFQVVDSDSDANSHESEDEDGYLLSVLKSKRAAETTLTDAGENLAKAKKRRKECSKEEKACDIEKDKDHFVRKEDKEHEVEASKNLENQDNHMVPSPESCSRNREKSKKRRKELQLEGTCTEGIDKFQNVAKDDKFEQDLLHADSTMKDLPAANEDDKQQIHNNDGINSELLANAGQPKKKTKKKAKNKTQGEGDLNIGLPDMVDNQESTFTKFENQTTNVKAIQNRTLSNGLIIEEVANGPPDGKVAASGKKVKIYYTAMLKENGHIFESNVGKTAYKFRLGDEGIIDGWNVGIEGMHVGDKRRLIIPPSMGFGKHGSGESVPPNSWLVYDVELVGVRK